MLATPPAPPSQPAAVAKRKAKLAGESCRAGLAPEPSACLPRLYCPHRGEQLWCRDGGTVSIEFDTTAKVEVADLHWRDLGMGRAAWEPSLHMLHLLMPGRGRQWQSPGGILVRQPHLVGVLTQDVLWL